MRMILPALRAFSIWMLLTVSSASTAQVSPAPNVDVVKHRLSSVIDELRSGSPNMTQFEPMLRIAIQQQQEKVKSYFAAMGAVKDISFEGEQNGADVFRVTFEHGVSAWLIGIAPNGNIAALYFQ